MVVESIFLLQPSTHLLAFIRSDNIVNLYFSFSLVIYLFIFLFNSLSSQFVQFGHLEEFFNCLIIMWVTSPSVC